MLAGGLGTRLAEETVSKPKPMVEFGEKPILWHILKLYSSFEINEFIICCGHKDYVVKEYFSNYFLHTSDVTFHIDCYGSMQVHQRTIEPWKVTLVNTGEHTQTGGKLRRIRQFLDEQPFCFTNGDGVADVNINALVEHDQPISLEATLTAVQPPGRYGALHLEGKIVQQFQEKTDEDNTWINSGFFVLKSSVLDRIAGDQTSWKTDVLPGFAADGQLSAYRHSGFWQPMDTLRDRTRLEELWTSGKAAWNL